MQKQWLEHFCKYRHICEFLGNEGKEKEEIKEHLMQELGLPEATACYQMTRALEDEDGIVKCFGWKFYLDEEKFKAAEMSTVKTLFGTNGSYAYGISTKASFIEMYAKSDAQKTSGLYGQNATYDSVALSSGYNFYSYI